MNKKELNFILQEGEGLKLEFKESLNNLDKELVAFANSEGGRIFLGVTDNKRIKGINITNKLKSGIQDIANNCDPKIKIRFEEFENILIIHVKEGQDKPYKCKEGFFIRTGPNSQKLKRDEIIDLIHDSGKIRFDAQLNRKFDRKKDFDKNKLNKFLQLAKISKSLSTEDTLINLGVAEKRERELFLNNAGMLFFAKNPGKFFLSSKVICVNYQTNEKVDVLDRKIFDNGIINNIQEAINYVKKHINVRFEIKTAKRKEILQYPEEAFRESIVNAVMHRDYVDDSQDVLIEIFKNKIIISNSGGLVKGLNPEDFGKRSITRNSIIANLLSRTEYVEKLGTGINRIKKAMQELGLPKPIFYYNSYFEVTLLDKEIENIQRVSGGVSGGVDSFLDYIQKNPGKRVVHFVNDLNIPRRTIERWLKQLREEGKIKFKGSPKSGGYYTTPNKRRKEGSDEII